MRAGDGRLARYEIASPHPEVTWRALFGKVWYEGYPRPSTSGSRTGGTDDFETKFSLVPLVFGTIKGTLYALLFAVPLAIMAALYTSQFVHPSIKARGEADGRDHGRAAQRGGGVHRRAVAGLARGARVVPRAADGRAAAAVRHRGRAVLGPHAARPAQAAAAGNGAGADPAPAAAWAAGSRCQSGPAPRRRSSAATSGSGSPSTSGLVYDQRNCLVVGLAMGFAVIPIIFTISEDASRACRST